MGEGMMGGFAAWDAAVAGSVLRGFAARPDAVLPMLHALQGRFGFVHDEAVGLVAAAVNVSRAEVHGVVSFYHDFRRVAPAGRVIRLCRAEACQAVGCEGLVAAAAGMGVVVDGGAADADGAGGVVIETVYCLGNCALGPAALVDGELVGLLDEAGLRGLVAGGSVARVQVPG